MNLELLEKEYIEKYRSYMKKVIDSMDVRHSQTEEEWNNTYTSLLVELTEINELKDEIYKMRNLEASKDEIKK